MTDEPEQLTGGPQDWIASWRISPADMGRLARHEAGHGVVWFACAVELVDDERLRQAAPATGRPYIRCRLVELPQVDGERQYRGEGGLHEAPRFFSRNYGAHSLDATARRELLLLELAVHAAGQAAEPAPCEHFVNGVLSLYDCAVEGRRTRAIPADIDNAYEAIRGLQLEQCRDAFARLAREGWDRAASLLAQPGPAEALDRLAAELTRQETVEYSRLLELLGDGVPGLDRVGDWLTGP